MTLFHSILLFFTVTTMVTSVAIDKPALIIKSAEIIRSVNNNPASTWKAESYGTPELNMKIFQTTRLGAKIDPDMFVERALTVENDVVDTHGTDDLPKNFRWQSTTNKLNCPVEKIRDQSNCGSCWAVSTAAAFSDRLCIKSKGKIRTPMSSSFIASCDSLNFGCEGGFMDKAYNFLKYNGTVTGGEYDSDEGCQPYPIRPCGTKPYLMPCATSTYTPKCKKTTCENDWYPYKQEETMYKIETWRFLRNESEARRELYENGPLTAAYMVYADFPFYKSGIYTRTSDTPMGGHAVRVVGWGEEKDVKYWLVANSWGNDWGENGHFRIVRGQNECGIEKQLQALTPLI